MQDDDNQPTNTFPVVGVGASAGGLDAFTELLRELPDDTGMGFVLVQHLHPEHKSILSEILDRVTPMDVVEAEDGMAIAPNTVYVIPSNKDLAVLNGVLSLQPRPDKPGPHMSVDHFFRSLAQDLRNRAIGVVLSGAASDGSQGLLAIKAEGGITFVQDPDTAAYDGMPLSAISAGAADFTCSPAEIARQIGALSRHPVLERTSDDEPMERARGHSEEELLTRAFLLLRNASGVDFSRYKRSTIRRRIARRMLLREVSGLEEYVDILSNDPDEVASLFEGLLIHVSGFFRDEELFDHLVETIFPRIEEAKEPGEAWRFWVIGCAQGQEAYSLAIALLEYFGERRRPPIQIFASDLNEAEIEKARAGRYPDSIRGELSEARLNKFFTESEGEYQVKKFVRELVVFARHDVTRDPPFSRLDLITCRNVLIYMGQSLQRRVLAVCHHALNPRGYLALGPSESVGTMEGMFDVIDVDHHTYRKDPNHEGPLPQLEGVTVADRFARPRLAPVPAQSVVADEIDPQSEADKIALSRFTPPSVLVNEDLQVVQFRGRTGAFLEHPPGRASLDLVPLLKEGLSPPLRRAIDRAKEGQGPAIERGVRFHRDGGWQTVDLDVVPILGSDSETFFLVSFRETDGPASTLAGAQDTPQPSEGEPGDADRGNGSRQLEEELDATREHLQAVMEEKDRGVEELRAAYEEIQSSNEELQSINEELETAKEELQSTNEELTTVNEELQRRNRELSGVNDDLSNLLSSINIPILIVDDDLTIRRFTRGVDELFKIVPSDVGRDLSDIRPRIELAGLEGLVTEVIDTMEVQELDTRDDQGRWWSVRVRPYKTMEQRIRGAVLSFVDVDELRRALDTVAEANDLNDALNRINAAIMATLDPEEIMNRVVHEARAALSIETAAFDLLEGDEWVVRQVSGLPEDLIGLRLSREDVPHADLAARTRLPVAVEDALDDPRVNPQLMEQYHIKSVLVAPIVLRGEVFGTVFFNSHSIQRAFTPQQIDFARKLTASASLALENANLAEARTRTNALNEALNELLIEIYSATDRGQIVEYSLERSTDVLEAGWGLSALSTRNGWRVTGLVRASEEPAGPDELDTELRRIAALVDINEPVLLSRENFPRRSPLVGDLPEDANIIAVPLSRDGAVIRLMLVASRPGRPYGTLEMDFARKVAAAVSLALANRRLYEAEHRTAEIVRRRLNPEVPEAPGLKLAAAHRSHLTLEQVGGDFYDAFLLDDGRLVMMVADVVGKGLEAAQFTETIRASVQTLLYIGRRPDDVFNRINQVLLKQGESPRLVTAVLFVIDPRTGEMSGANAGHPPPVLCGRECSLMEVPPGPPLGVTRHTYEPIRANLGEGERLILYTDGITESRRGGEIYGEERLVASCLETIDSPLQEVVDTVVQRAMDFSDGRLHDDIAVLGGMRVPAVEE